MSELIPSKAALFLGAGASVESGGPIAGELAEFLWRDLEKKDEPPSNDFIEICSILEMRRGRTALANAVQRRLKHLEPTGGLLLVPSAGFKALYTTNFDRLIERAFLRAEVPLTVIRSNYDYQMGERPTATCLYKIHGCINQDEHTGSRARMTLTERDYEDHAPRLFTRDWKLTCTVATSFSLDIPYETTIFVNA